MTLRFGKANIIVTVVFFHQVLPLSLAAFLFQGRAITNFPFLLSLLSLMLICQHFFLWSFIVCPASALLALFWQLLQTCLLLCPSHFSVCVIFVGAFDVWHDLTSWDLCLKELAFLEAQKALKKQMKGRNHLEPMSSWGYYQQIVLCLIPFPKYGTLCNFLYFHPTPCTLCLHLHCQEWPGAKMDWDL